MNAFEQDLDVEPACPQGFPARGDHYCADFLPSRKNAIMK